MIIKGKKSSCECIKQVNEKLRDHNAKLDLRFQINFRTGLVHDSPPLILVTKIDAKKRKPKLPTVACTFCPFCGRKYK